MQMQDVKLKQKMSFGYALRVVVNIDEVGDGREPT
jgi:hypothetical protein